MARAGEALGGKRLVAVGRIGRAHGVGGEVRVDPMGGLPRGLAAYSRVYAGSSAEQLRRVEVESCRTHGRLLLVKFSGIGSPEAARGLLNATLYVERSEMPPLEEGEYYHADLLGCRVVDSDGEDLGVVADVLTTGAHDVLVVASRNGEWMLPIVGEYVLAMDVDGGQIRVKVPEGLRD